LLRSLSPRPNGSVPLAFCDLALGFSFQFAQSQTETVLHSFSVDAGGAGPRAVVVDSAGNLYGATTLVVISRAVGIRVRNHLQTGLARQRTLLYTFTGGADGSFLTPAWFAIRSANLYGTASEAAISIAMLETGAAPYQVSPLGAS